MEVQIEKVEKIVNQYFKKKLLRDAQKKTFLKRFLPFVIILRQMNYILD